MSAQNENKCSRLLRLVDYLRVLDQCETVQGIDPIDSEVFEFYSVPEVSHRRARNEFQAQNLVDFESSNEISVLKEPNPTAGLKDCSNPMENIPDEIFHETFAFRKSSVLRILRHIEFGWHSEWMPKCMLSPLQSLLLTLHFLVNGTLAYKIPDLLPTILPGIKVSQPSVSRIIARVTNLLADMRTRIIKHPSTCRDQDEVRREFEAIAGMSSIIGCVGSTHVAIRTPPRYSSSDYVNDEGFYSYRFAAICGPNGEFYEIATRWPGASNENNIFNLSEFNQKLEANRFGECFVLANECYACTCYVLTPIELKCEQLMSQTQRRYNEAHRQTYVFKKAIDRLKRRFQCLKSVLRCKDGEL